MLRFTRTRDVAPSFLHASAASAAPVAPVAWIALAALIALGLWAAPSTAAPTPLGPDQILGAGWAGREQAVGDSNVKSGSSAPGGILRPAPLPEAHITPDQFARSLVISTAATALPIGLGTLLLAHSETPGPAIALISIAAFFGPSAGQFRYGFHSHAVAGTTLRLAGVLMVAGGFAQGFSNCNDAMFSDTDDNCSERGSSSPGLMVAGGLVYLGSALYSLIQPAFAIRHEPARTYLPVEVLPRLSYDGHGGQTAGLIAGWHF